MDSKYHEACNRLTFLEEGSFMYLLPYTEFCMACSICCGSSRDIDDLRDLKPMSPDSMLMSLVQRLALCRREVLDESNTSDEKRCCGVGLPGVEYPAVEM
jgi:hypothetical protein